MSGEEDTVYCLRIIGATELPLSPSKKNPNTYVKIMSGTVKHETKVIKRNRDPVWNEEIQFTKQRASTSLHFSVRQKHSLSNALASTEIEVLELLNKCQDGNEVELDLKVSGGLPTQQVQCRIRILLWTSSGASRDITAPTAESLSDSQLQIQAAKRSSELYDLANSILTDCKRNAHLSDLDSIICTLHEASALPPPRHPRGSDLLNHLAMALVTRFWYTGQPRDLDEAIVRCCEALILHHNIREPELMASQPHGNPVFRRNETVENVDPESAGMVVLTHTRLTRFLRSAQMSSLDTAVSLHRDALVLRPENHLKWSASLNGLALALVARFHHTQELRDIDEGILLYHEARILMPESPNRPELSMALLTRFCKTHQIIDLRDAFEYLNEKHIQNPEASKSFGLAGSLRKQFQQTSQLSDLETAVSLYQRRLHLLSAQNPYRWNMLNNLASLFSARFGQTGLIEDVDDAIKLHREALEQAPMPHPNRSVTLNNLGSVLLARCSKTDFADVDEAIAMHQEAVGLLPAAHPHRPASLYNLAIALSARFDHAGQIKDIDKAITTSREALSPLLAPHPYRSVILSDLAISLHKRFTRTEQVQDVDEAIKLHREALGVTPVHNPKRSASLDNLASAISTRFRRTSCFKDLDEATVLHREVLGLLPAHHPQRPGSLNNLAGDLSARFYLTGEIKDIDDAITLHRESLGLLHARHHQSDLRNLANALAIRFTHTGQVEDMDEAIALHREVLRTAPRSHQLTSLSALANVLELRFDHIGQVEDVEEAITLYRKALNLLPAHHPERPASLSGIGTALHKRFGKTGQIEDVEEAIEMLREAVTMLPVPHPRLGGLFSNLAGVLELRYGKTHHIEDVEEAIALYRKALELLPAQHTERPGSLNSFASVLITRFEKLNQLPDAEEAIKTYHEALLLLSQHHPESCKVSTNLGRVYLAMFVFTKQSIYLDNAVSAFRGAVTCQSASASMRFTAAQLWTLLAHNNSHGTALEAYQHAIELLPRLAVLSLDLQARQQVLASGIEGLARRAAACAIQCGFPDKAAGFLEDGRNVFWSQALQLRTPLNKVNRVAPELARKLENISRALEQGAFRDVAQGSSATEQRFTMEQEAAYYRGLNKDWSTVVEEIRELDGFEDFLRPNSQATLKSLAAANSPIIMLNASDLEYDALILTSSGVKHVPLPKFTVTVEHMLVELMQTVSGTALPVPPSQLKALIAKTRFLQPLYQDDRGSMPARKFVATPDDIFRAILATLWSSVAKPIVHALDLKKSESPPRLWWCPTGVFTFLPIHAAGIYEPEDGERLSQYAVSSYTPTLNALRSSLPPTANTFKMMAVIQPHAPGFSSLPLTRTELEKIEEHAPPDYLVKLGIPEAPATVEDVFLHLSTVSIAHFACHGVQDMEQPLESALILDGGERLKVSRIMEQSMPNASLAFLSACETAMGDKKLPDEAMHLAASLLFAGFHGTVATMWSMADEDGPKIADSFYSSLFQTTEALTTATHPYPDTTQAARALHLAVAKLRDDGCSFKRWVPFIHLGL